MSRHADVPHVAWHTLALGHARRVGTLANRAHAATGMSTMGHATTGHFVTLHNARETAALRDALDVHICHTFEDISPEDIAGMNGSATLLTKDLDVPH